MRKKLGLLVFAVITVVFAYLYSNFDKAVPVYSKNVTMEKLENVGEISQQTVVEQSFLVPYKSLKGLKFKVDTMSHKEVEATLNYEVTSENDREVLASGTVNASEVGHYKYLDINFDKEIVNRKGQVLKVTVTDNNTKEGKGISIASSSILDEGYPVRVNNSQGGILIMKTVSHVFDIETFVITLVILLYISCFMRLLYRFFR